VNLSTNAKDMVFDSLANFINYASSDYKHFVIFPHNLSECQWVEDLPPTIENMEKLPEEAGKWLTNFLQAKPHFKRGHLYVSFDWSEPPIPKVY